MNKMLMAQGRKRFPTQHITLLILFSIISAIKYGEIEKKKTFTVK